MTLTAWGLNHSGGKFSTLVQVGPKAHLPSCAMDVGSSWWCSGQGVVLTTHPLLVVNSLELYLCLPSVPA